MEKPRTSYKLQNIRRAISENFIAFGQSTVLSGFNYVSNRSLRFFDRIFFLLSFVLIFITVITLTTDIYTKWGTTPVIVTMAPHPILINKLPFPAITICNVNQARASKVAKFSRTSVEYAMLQTLCRRSVDNVNPKKLADFKNRTLFRRFIQDNAQPCEKLLLSCKFGTIVKNCMGIFKPIITDEGQCCVFNSAHSSFLYKDQKTNIGLINADGSVGVEWNIEYGYRKRLPDMYYPRVASGTGVSLGLTIVINAEVNDYYCTSRNGPGFKLLLHNPIETPLLRDHGLYFEAGSEIAFRISADRSEASENIRNFQITDRKCLFNSERNLGYFRTYTKRNCEMECLANLTASICGCISYFLPKTKANIPNCSLKDVECTQLVLNWTPESAAKLNIKGKTCSELCLQGCFDLSFNPSGFSIPLTSGGYQIKDRFVEKFNSTYLKENIAVVSFYYKLSHFDGFMRTRYVGITEFLSATGGLFGLLGFSFIAVAEIVYFWILKPLKALIWNNAIRKRVQKKEEMMDENTCMPEKIDKKKMDDRVFYRR